MFDVSTKELNEILELARVMKKKPKKFSNTLSEKSLALLFEKTSTRTMTSFFVGMTQLGGHAIFLDWQKTNFTLGAMEEEIGSVSRYVDAIMFRAYTRKEILTAAKASSVPLINGLDDTEHPCQTLADLLTIKEHSKNVKQTTVAFVGDGNNVCNSLIAGCALLGIKINVATPKGYEPRKEFVKFGEEKKVLKLFNDPKQAAANADFVYTDTWVSMGQEKEKEKRLHDFNGFSVDKRVLGKAKFMHCLPAHIGLEVTEDVLRGKQSIVFDQAENRLHAQKALLVKLLK